MNPSRSGLRPPPPQEGAADGPAKPVPWRLQEWAALFGALVAGIAQALSIGAPWNGQPVWWLQLLSLALLAWLVRRSASWKQSAALGWTFATAWLCATHWWLYISLHTYGGLPAPLTLLAVLGLAAFLGSFYAAACGAFRALARTGWAWNAIFFGALWMLGELLRATLFTGFPWGAGGYAHTDGPLSFLAPWVGVYGVGFVAAVLAFGLSLASVAAHRRSWKYWGGAAAAAALLTGGQAATLASQRADDARSAQGQGRGGSTGLPRLSVALLQGNIPQDEKFGSRTGVPFALDWYGAQLQQSTATLVVTPETALPLLPRQLPEGYLQALRDRFADGERAALIGIPLGSFTEGYTNSVIGFKPGAALWRYDKHHLVPFGEFIPPLFKWFTEMMNIPLGDFNRGAVGQPSFEWRGQRLALNICYEDLFGEELAARFIDPKSAPTIFVNVSNIGWFGNTVAIDQHLLISRMRALEFERPMIRATNTGATAIIDHRGRVAHLLPRYTRGVLEGEVEGREAITPFAWWAARAGLWPLWLLGSAIVLGAVSIRVATRKIK